MKGLLIKDMRLLLNQKMTVLVILLLGIFMATNGGDASFSLGYMMMISIMLVVVTISYDSMENGMAYLFTLPVKRKQYVVEKYILAIFTELLAAGYAVLIQLGSILFGQQADWKGFLIVGALMMAVCMLLLAVYIPVYIKFGPEKSFIAIFIVFGAVALAAYLVSKIKGLQTALEKLIEVLDKMSAAQLIGTGVGIWALLMAGSVLISMRIVEKKEF